MSKKGSKKGKVKTSASLEGEVISSSLHCGMDPRDKNKNIFGANVTLRDGGGKDYDVLVVFGRHVFDARGEAFKIGKSERISLTEYNNELKAYTQYTIYGGKPRGQNSQ